MDAERVQALLDGFHHARTADLENLHAALDPVHPLRPAARCLADHLIGGPARAAASLDRALASPPRHADVHACLLSVAFRRAFEALDYAQCERVLEHLHGMAGALRDGRCRLLACRHEYLLALRQRDRVRQRGCVTHALTRPWLVAGDDLWLEWAHKRFLCGVDDWDFVGAQTHLEELRPHAARLADALGVRFRVLELLFLSRSGQYRRVRELLEPSVRDASVAPEFLLAQFLVEACLLGGEMARGRRYRSALPRWAQMQDQGGDAASLFATAIEELTALEHLLADRLDAARAALQNASRLHPHPQSHLPSSLQNLVGVELSMGHVAAAADLLARIDPRGERGDLHMAWCRLHRWRGEHAAARERFARVVAQPFPGVVAREVQLARELQAVDVARLLPRGDAPTRATSVRVPRPSDPRSAMASAGRLVGASSAMAHVRAAIEQLAAVDATVLVTGETGTGKECVARQLHAQGARGKQPFVALNCAAVPEALAEAELFGHSKGAFTGADRARPGLFATAGTGTLFLDEISSMAPRLQGVLLRVLETGEYRAVGGRSTRRSRARVVVASNEDLAALVDGGRFRADLYYRLERFTIDLPPLRERRGDIPALCRHFVERLFPDRELDFGEDLLQVFAAHTWPGNVRELRNEVERLAVLHPDAALLTARDTRLAPVKRAASMGHEPDRAMQQTAAAQAVFLPGNARTRARLQHLLELFDAQRHVYRADAVAHLQCAPATAAKSLRMLGELGLVRHVATSANPRTAYWERVG